MADKIDNYITCKYCDGSGILNITGSDGQLTTTTCFSCLGSGTVKGGHLDSTQLQANINKILKDLKQIKKKLDIEEEDEVVS